MVCKCDVPGWWNYESVGKEGKWSTFGFPWIKPIVKIGFLFQDILIILLGIKVHASSISGKGYTHGDVWHT